MSEAVGVGNGDAGSLAMVPKQRAQPGRGHFVTASPPLERNKQGSRSALRPLHVQIVIDELSGLWSKGQKTCLLPLAGYTELRLREQQVAAL